MVAEYRMLRFSASLHPLALIRDQLPPSTISSSRFTELPNGSTIQLAGIVVARQRPQTAKGFVFVLCEDEDGPVNVIVKPDIYQRDRTTIRMEPFVTVRGRLQKDGETINVIAHEVRALRLGGGAQAPVPKPGPTRGGVSKPATASRPSINEEELYPALPWTQEWWPDRGKFKKAAEGGVAGDSGAAASTGAAETGSGRRNPQDPDRNQRHRQAAQEEAARERKKEARRDGRPSRDPGPQRRLEPSPEPSPAPLVVRERANAPAREEAPELPEVREWWGKPEEARKSPFYYLTALRQSPPGTKSWG